MNTEYVVLVDREDRVLGSQEKLSVHVQGVLHRAFSIFIFNRDGELLLQKRAQGKYHSPNLWTNACCGHPRPGEETTMAAERRLIEELGLHTKLDKQFSFIYQAEVDPLFEHELDHVYFGRLTGAIFPAPEEIDAIRWVTLDKIEEELKDAPDRFTYWFRYILSLERFSMALESYDYRE